MKAKLKFNLDDPQDQMEFNLAVRGKDLALLLWKYDQYLRGEYKHGGKEEAYEYRKTLIEMMNEAGIDLDALLR
jgi:hypothetical protein